jgi:hypothetical protein
VDLHPSQMSELHKTILSFIGVAVVFFVLGWAACSIVAEYDRLAAFEKSVKVERQLASGWHWYHGLLIPPAPPRNAPVKK